ncbi:MAG: hypothetical protein LLF76_11010 [Planctomycetaceae bacterium]|nr:hypothetical protein [Planctomycetaceae bacterium]
MNRAKPISSKKRVLVLAMLYIFAFLPVTFSQEPNDLISNIDRLIALGPKAPDSLAESINKQIENDPSAAADALLLGLSDPNSTEGKLASMFGDWALPKIRKQLARSCPLPKPQPRTWSRQTVCGPWLRSAAGNRLSF